MTSRARHPDTASAVADRLHSAAIHLLRHVRRTDAGLGLGPARLSALSVLVFGGPCTLKRLAAVEQVTPATMSRIVAALAEGGLVRREADPADRRAVRLHATRLGRSVLRRGRERRVAALAERLAALTPRQLDELDRAAELIEQTLSER